jgi:hypothetical protein
MMSAKFLLFVALAACHSGRRSDLDRPTVEQATAPDSVRGRISVVGSEPMTEVVLRPRGGTESLALAGAQVAMLRGLAGIDVLVRGRRTGTYSRTATPQVVAVFEVESFVVRAVSGIAATDGIVAVEGGRFYLVLQDGSRLAVTHFPTVLQKKIGARVFIAGPLDREAATYGLIAERR